MSNRTATIEGTEQAMDTGISSNDTHIEYSFATYATGPQARPADATPSEGRFADPRTGRADPERIRRWLAEDPRLARYMTSSSTDTAAGLIRDLRRLDAVMGGLVSMFRNDGRGGMAGDLSLADRYMQGLRVQLAALGDPNLTAVPLIIDHPIPLGRVLLRRVPAVRVPDVTR